MLHSSELCRLAARQTISSSSSMYTAHISIPLGIIIGLLASFVQSLGLTIQRKSHVLNQVLPEHKQRVEHRRPLWLLGFGIFISSNILGSLVQIASLPVVILAPLGAVSLLWNAFFARLILGDVFSPWMILGTVLIAGGAVLIAVFGIVPEPTRSLEDLLELFKRPTFVAYFSILGAVVFICLAITHIADYSFARRLSRIVSPVVSSPSTPILNPTLITPKPSALTTGPTIPIADTGTSTERTPLLDRRLTQPSPPPSFQKTSQDPEIDAINRTRLLLAISYASFSGIISGMCLLFAKSGVELLLLTWRGQNQFWRWQAWVLVLGLVVFALLQLWYLHKALVLADPTLVCPSAFCFYNLSSIVNGLVYFDQFSLIPPLYLGLVVLGIVVLLGGVWVVSIKSGSGEIDTESWNESSDLDDDIEEGRYMESSSHSSDSEIIGDEVAPIRQSRRLHPALVKRETRSESNVHVLSASPEIIGLRGEFEPGSPPRPHSTVSQPVLQSFTSLSPEREPSSTSLERQLSPPRTRSHRRRPTLDTSHTSSSRHTHTRTTSNNHAHASYAQISPPGIPLHSVSTLGAGFQIGLSPVSPGFAIVPRERGRRLSGLGLGAGPGFSDVVMDVTSSEHREARRRRTVSEGDVRRRALALASGRRAALEGRTTSDVSEEEVGSPRGVTRKKGKEREGGGKGRWKWLKKVFMRNE